MLEAAERTLRAKLAKNAWELRSRAARLVSPADARREWEEAAGDVTVRHAILSRYLKAVIIRKSSTRGPGNIDYSAIEPVWREDDDALPGAYTA
jgi:hypothetical protein